MNIYNDLEFHTILNNIAALATARPTADAVLESKPTVDIDTAQKLLIQTGDAINILASRNPMLDFDDVLPIIAKAKVGAVLTPKDLLAVKDGIRALRSVKKCIEDVPDCDSLKDITAYARICDELENSICNVVESETEIKDSASERLRSIRRAISRANAKLKEKLDSYTRAGEFSKYLQDNIVTMRGGRYVLPVRNDCRSMVKGLVHDVSATGATVFIEPYAVVEFNNEIITLKTEENNEIERILAELSAAVAKNSEELTVGQQVLIECGVIFAKAEYAKRCDAYSPSVNNDGKILLKGARHPLIDPATVVPVDIELTEKHVLLISGPNTGGKTVALKTVGLFSLMAACGIFLPTNDGSVISIFDKIYCDIGDSQSISQSLSTFSAHVKNLAEITAKMDKRSLVLLDEVGDGTDPDEGAALAIAVIKSIIEKNATAVVTTHFNSVKEFALGCSSVANASMQFDSVSFKPTFKLIQGVSGSSYALEIAERLGLDAHIIADARAALSTEKIAFDKVMREAELLRNALIEQKQDSKRLLEQAKADADATERIKQEYAEKLEYINDNARSIIKRRTDEYSDEAEEIIEKLKEKLKNANERSLFEARKLSKSLHDNIPSDPITPKISASPCDPAALKIGTEVYISGLDKIGVIASNPHGNKAMVAIGSIKTEIPLSSLSVVVSDKKAVQQKSFKREVEPENKEIMLLGKTVDEATSELDIILSDIAPHSVLRIVHGKGTGALGKGIQAYLRRHSRVKSFRYGRYGEGDTGVTIAEIK